ncbi:uncharacterized protein LOC109823658 [Asparagus officinalis]|uniref:uncharacterized protein LOC109823658 n=1 Tax=Asparagus officinalis TaxID=4686 RepID=UPI00098DE5DA|nr:uncharacterized protein LOC109823658 [Asparagus officinalis]
MGALTAYETRQQTTRLNLLTYTPTSSLETALFGPVIAPVMNHTSQLAPSLHARSKLSYKYYKEGHRIETWFKFHPELRSSCTGRGRRPPQSQPSRTSGLLANTIPSTTSDTTIQAIEGSTDGQDGWGGS